MKHFKHLALAALAVGALTPATAQAAGPATVDLQVEGGTAPLVPTTTLTTTTAPVTKDGENSCSGTAIIGALEQATRGDWSGRYFGGYGYTVERIFAESHPFNSGRTWSLYVNGQYANQGICDFELQDGDDVLFYALCFSATTACYAGDPLHALAPRTAAPGSPFTVTVRESTTTYDSNGVGTTTLAPSQGASVNGTTTSADGTARTTLTERGRQLVVVTKGDRPPERVPVCVTDGADGFCGTSRPGPGQSPPPVAAGAPLAVRAKFTTVREGQVFPKGGGPAFIRGTVTGPGRGIDRVRIRLTRNDRGRCSTLDPVRERQRRIRCGAKRGLWIDLGDREQFEYQVPFTTPRGRWVLDVQVRDRVGRVSRLERGGTRVVFRVR